MTSVDTVRAFFAAPLPEALRSTLATAIQELRRADDLAAVRWVDAPSLHVTLRFLGSVATEAIPKVLARVEAAVSDVAPFTVRLDRIDGFPSRGRPRVVVAHVDADEALTALAVRVEGAVVAAGLEPDARPFRAHVTLGRVRERLRGAPALPVPIEAELPIDRVVLYRSQSGRRYSELGGVRLAGGTVGAR